MKVNFGNGCDLRKFDIVKCQGMPKKRFTIVRAELINGAHTMTLKRIPHFKWKFLNRIVMFFVKVIYHQQ